MLLLVLLLLPSLSLSTLPAGPTSSHDPTKCIDIPCYKPIEWSNDKEEVCRFKKDKKCIERREELFMEVLETRCELVDYTKCDWDKSLVPVRDDKVVGEKFVEKECFDDFTITVKEKKPKCINVTKPSCEEKWIPEPPFWVLDPSTCVDLNWTICNETYLHPVPIDYCDCIENEIWYNKLERVETQCVEEHTTCVPKVVPVCKTVPVPMKKNVTWIECWETCEPDCSPMHFRQPSQDPDHRRWCSHVEIIVPPGVNVSPNNKQSTKVTNSNDNIVSSSNDNIVSNSNDNIVSNSKVNIVSNDNVVSNSNDNVVSNSNDNVASIDNVVSNSNDNVVSNPRSKKGNSFSNGKAETTYSNQRSNFQKTPNPDSLGSPLVYSRSASSSNRRSSVPHIFKGKRTIRQGQQIRG